MKGMLPTSIHSQTPMDNEQKQSPGNVPGQEGCGRELQGAWKYKLLCCWQGQVEPSQPPVQAVTSAKGLWLNRAHTAKTNGESEHLTSHSSSEQGRDSLFTCHKGKKSAFWPSSSALSRAEHQNPHPIP